MFFGLSLRQFVFSICAALFAVGCIFLSSYVGMETVVDVFWEAFFRPRFPKIYGMRRKIHLGVVKSDFCCPKRGPFTRQKIYTSFEKII
jgi:hypothetical protein